LKSIAIWPDTQAYLPCPSIEFHQAPLALLCPDQPLCSILYDALTPLAKLLDLHSRFTLLPVSQDSTSRRSRLPSSSTQLSTIYRLSSDAYSAIPFSDEKNGPSSSRPGCRPLK
jgi:hypothetical protein